MSFRPCSAYQITLTGDLQEWLFPFIVTVDQVTVMVQKREGRARI